MNQVLDQHSDAIQQIQNSIRRLEEKNENTTQVIEQQKKRSSKQQKELSSVQEACETLATAHRDERSLWNKQFLTLEDNMIRLPDIVLSHATDVFATKQQVNEYARIVDVNESLQHKANKDAVDQSLQRKVNREEIKEVEARLLTSQKNSVARIVQNTLVNYLSDDHPTSDDIDLKSLLTKLAAKPQVVETKSMTQDIEQQIQAVRADCVQLIRRESLQWDDALRTATSELTCIIRQKAMASDVQLSLSSKIDRQEAIDLLKTKLSTREVEQLVQQQVQGLVAQVQQMTLSLKQELVTVLNKKAYKSDVSRSLEPKANSDEVRKWIAEKANLVDVRDLCGQTVHIVSRSVENLQREIQQDTESVRALVQDKLSRSELETHLIPLKQQVEGGWQTAIEELRSEIALKVGIKDACTLLDMKSNITDVNEALDMLHQKMEAKSGLEELESIKSTLMTLKQHVRGEICLGRWVWKSGRPSGSQLVIWNVQAVNTSPDVFIWERNGDTITTVIPGLYQINAAFFTERAPTVQIMINGEPALIACETSHAKLKAIRRARHSAGNVTGLTICEFLALPARCQLSISYDIDEKAQGFISLRKL